MARSVFPWTCFFSTEALKDGSTELLCVIWQAGEAKAGEMQAQLMAELEELRGRHGRLEMDQEKLKAARKSRSRQPVAGGFGCGGARQGAVRAAAPAGDARLGEAAKGSAGVL